MNLFEALEGRRSEDLATQALAFVLESPAFRELQRLFYERILQDRLLLCSRSRQFRVATQESDPRLGRPDLKIEGEETLILLENKLSALFSGGDQLRRYVEILENAGRATRVLVLVCPGHLRSRYQHDALSQFTEGETPFLSFEALQDHLRTKGITLLVVPWEEVLRILDSGHVLVSELMAFLRERFLVHIQISRQEVQRIMDSEIPVLLQKILAMVDRIKGEIGQQDIEVGRSSQSINVYGFNLTRGGYHFWFGYFLPEWRQYGTPLFLQSNPHWGVRVPDEARLLQVGFIRDERCGLLLPVRLEAGEETALGAVVSQLQQAIEQVTR